MSRAGKLNRKIEIWGKVDAFYTSVELDLMSLEDLKTLADDNLIAYASDIAKVDLVSLILDAEPIEILDDLGQVELKEVKIASLWAEIIPKTGTMLNGRAADTILSKTTNVLRIRYRKEYEVLNSNTNWIVVGGHRFEIDYILNPYFKNEFLEIFCSEVV